MEVVNTDITIYRGDSDSLTVSAVQLVDNVETPVPFVTGDTVYFTVKKGINTTAKLLQKVITTFVNGEAVVGLDPIDTRNIPPGEYRYDIQLNSVDGKTKTSIVKDSLFTVEGDITYE